MMCLSGGQLMYVSVALTLAILIVIWLDWRYWK